MSTGLERGFMEGQEAVGRSIAQVVDERAIFPTFQPIVDLASGQIVGAEALARGPSGTALESAAGLFAAARQAGMLSVVDQLCFTRAMEEARRAGAVTPPLVFANVEPEVAHEPIAPELLDMIRAPRPFRIVMEYAERSLQRDAAALVMLAGMAYADGNGVALDDVGADPMSVAMLPLLEPSVVKLDGSLLREPDSPATTDVVSVVNAYVRRTGAVVIAEGIETEGDLATALRLGATWGQGWMLGRPGPLSALSGRERHPSPDLHVPAPYVPEGSGFAVVAERSDIVNVDAKRLENLVAGVLGVAAVGGSHTMVVANYSDDTTGAVCRAELAGVQNVAAYVHAAPAHSSHVQSPPETALVVIAPHAVAVLCARPVPGGRFEVVTTLDHDQAHIVARMLINSSSPYPRF